jgi:hypothetical protein
MNLPNIQLLLSLFNFGMNKSSLFRILFSCTKQRYNISELAEILFSLQGIVEHLQIKHPIGMNILVDGNVPKVNIIG